ncbi:MAG: hypothetical protein C0392_14905 [Syntrophus sp. (in: bacteria)]|nr:hypothetical protein [Syntrophus sp. (in: bacteria)]
MKKLRLYLEKSTWNFYFADDTPEKKEITIRFYEKIKRGEYEVFISDLVIAEMNRAGSKKKDKLLTPYI